MQNFTISGNEITLMEKIKSNIIEKIQKKKRFQIKNIDTIIGFVDEVGLLKIKVIFKDSYKGINDESYNAGGVTK